MAALKTYRSFPIWDQSIIEGIGINSVCYYTDFLAGNFYFPFNRNIGTCIFIQGISLWSYLEVVILKFNDAIAFGR